MIEPVVPTQKEVHAEYEERIYTMNSTEQIAQAYAAGYRTGFYNAKKKPLESDDNQE